MKVKFNTRAHQDILVRPVVSEKGYEEQQFGKYRFEVHPHATKIDVKHAVEAIYKVNVTRVNMIRQAGKRRRLRFRIGTTPEWKKAIVTLKEGEHIDFFEKV